MARPTGLPASGKFSYPATTSDDRTSTRTHVRSARAQRATRRLVSFAAFLLVFALAAAPLHAQYFRFGKNKVQYTEHDWQYLQSKHFDVYFYDGGEYLANFTAKAAEDAYAQISDLFQYKVPERIPLVVYQGHNDFAVTNVAELPPYAEGIGGVTELFKNRIAIPFTGDYAQYRRVVHHELVHAVVNEMFYGGSIQSIIQNNIQLQIPLWFNEGLAEYAAQGWDTQSDMYVREAVLEDELAPIRGLNGYFAYRGGQSVWDYVASQYGREKIGEILHRVRSSRSVEDAFKRSTGLSLKELSDRWHKALEEIYYPEIAAREDLDVIADPIITREDNGGYYNTSPALSPQGDKVVYISSEDGLFDVYLARASDGKTLRKLIEGQVSTAFESLNILSPGITWSPDGRHIALSVKSGSSDAIAVVDIETGETQHYRIPHLDQIFSLDWSPDGSRIAFSASQDAQSDIYVLALASSEVTNYTNDLFSDHEPAWSPDGEAIAFHSDRGEHVMLGAYRAPEYSMIEADYSQDDVYLLRLSSTVLERLTDDAQWDDRSADFAGPDRILFISDRNGIENLYEQDLTAKSIRPVTNLSVGLMQASLSASGNKAALVSLREGTPSIYILKRPLERDVEDATLTPTLWAQRASGRTDSPAPAVALAPKSLQQNNPFMRDATDAAGYERFPFHGHMQLARYLDLYSEKGEGRPDLASLPARDPLLSEGGSEHSAGESGDSSDTGSESSGSAADSTAYGSVRVDFRNYIFGDAFDRASDEERKERGTDRLPDVFDPPNNLDEDGEFLARDYKLKFSPDFIYGSTGYDVLYGVQGITQMMFSDMLGNHSLTVATNLLVDLRTSDYFLSYDYLPHRTDWGIFIYHVARQLQDFNRSGSTLSVRYYRYRHYGAGISMSYPLNKFERVDVAMSLRGVNQADISDPSIPPVTRSLIHPTVTFTRDISTPGLLAPRDGYRMAFSVSGSPGNFVAGEQVRFATVLGDMRWYTSFGGSPYSFAARLSGGSSVGPDQQLFYASGVQNWLNRRFDQSNGYPIDDVTDFLFATPVLPLRAYAINSQNGSHFGLVNAEFRFPLVAALLPGPIPIIPLYNLQGTAFVDAGSIWGGSNIDNARFNVWRINEEGQRVFDDLLVGAGVGLRTILLGYPVRMDFAWPFDGRSFGERHFYISIGLDF